MSESFGETRVVDAHQHLWDFEANPYPWLSDTAPGSVAERLGCYGVEEYRRDVADWAIAATVHVEANWDPRDPVGETRWLQAVHDRCGMPTAIVAAARLEAPDVRETLEAHLRHPLVHGIRQLLNWAEDPEMRSVDRADLMVDAAWRRGFALLAPLGLSFDLCVFPPQMPDAATLAAAHPETSIVLNHVGFPDLLGDDRPQWREGMRRLADCANVTVKLSGLVQPGRTAEQMREYVEETLEIFGCERAMFASNLPVEHLGGSPDAFVEVLRQALAGRSAAERDAVWGATAANVYRL
jgi:predicted TIM-barrel fold metal-dependent hydrolase